MIQQGVLPLNIFVSCFHLIMAAIALTLLKKSTRPLSTAEPKMGKNNAKQDLKGVDFNYLFAVSWLKKYTLIGGAFYNDQKFMVKEVLIIAVFGITCLHINKMILWPASLSLAVLVTTFILWEVVAKKWSAQSKEAAQVKPNLVNPQAESELEIEAVIVEPKINIIKHTSSLQQAKHHKNNRTAFETLTIAVLIFACLVMQLQTILTLSTSVSNSGQLNIISVLTAIAIDQVIIRIPLGLTLLLGIKLHLLISGELMEQSTLVGLICSQEITLILVEKQKERERKALEMAASPPRKKQQSPSRIPKAILQSAQRPTYLNLINLQPTVREEEVVEEVVLTAAEKDLFEGCDDCQGDRTLQEKNGFYTRRQRGREQNQYYSHSAQKGTTIDVKQKKQFDDMLILRDDPFGEIENIGEFELDDNYDIRATKRNGTRKRKNKRNLKLTGDSPYLQYLPDMLKKVDKFKEVAGHSKENATKPIR